MVCLNCVEMVEVRLRVPKQVYDFFTGELEWSAERFECALLGALESVLDYYPIWRKAEEIRGLIQTFYRDLDP